MHPIRAFPVLTARRTHAQVDSKHGSINEEAERLLTLLNLFYPMDDSLVPKNSVLREFTGGSVLEY